MGGKSRKTGGISRALINRIIKQDYINQSNHNTKDLVEKINLHYDKANIKWHSALLHAKLCGFYLRKAKKLVEHGCWLQWIDDNFKGKRETAKKYMFIAKNWNHPEILKLRNSNFLIDSMNEFFRAIPRKNRSKKSVNDATQKFDQKWAELYSTIDYENYSDEKLSDVASQSAVPIRKDIFKRFRDKLHNLHTFELEVLNKHWDFFDKHIERSLRNFVSKEIGYDPYSCSDKEKVKRDLEENLKKLIIKNPTNVRKSA
jgi:hypothetical protein